MSRTRSFKPATVITVTDKNNTYTARCDGESRSCTAGHEQAARRLASVMTGLPENQIILTAKPRTDSSKFIYEFCA
jgi:hypothetical protein